ncbi:MAG: tRNA threonylcarbamoyladenosine biosynthesis protein TsaE [Dokdonia sp.]|jgi:tRNA threonylcarbamoyladenosine biosynthesis protein TsaE
MKITYELSEIDSIAAQILKRAKSKVLLFYGEMGVGKTTLIKSITQQLGIQETAVSPTFSIVNEYRNDRDMVIYHFDCYRLEQPEEILDLGFEEYVYEGDLVLIEWPQNIEPFLPDEHTEVRIETKTNNNRTLTIHEVC